MKMDMRVTGADSVVAMFRNLATKVPENARKVMHRGADAVVKEARLNVPEDDLELHDSIRKEISYEGRGRLKIDVVMGGMVRGVNVDRYAIIIHENYEQFKPGPRTLAKMTANPGRWIGSKFLERAGQKQAEKLTKGVIVEIDRTIRNAV